MKCYTLIPHWDNIKFNIGFWLLLSLFFCNIIFMLIVRMHETFTFYSKIYTITKSNPSNQNQRYFTEVKQSNKDIVTLQNIVIIQKEVSSKKTKIIVQKKKNSIKAKRKD